MTSFSAQAVFEYGYEKLTGTPASAFEFVPGRTPLSTYREVGMVTATYLAVIFGGQLVMKRHKPLQLNLLFQIHNAFLVALSLGLFVLFLENVLPIMFLGTEAGGGIYGALCSAPAFTQRLELLYYINYLTKFYELLDTCFLVARKKKLNFLHWYHHSMTALLCFVQLKGRSTVAWVPVTLNLAVHVLMYYYYLLATFNIRVWWKKYITVMQIAQFIVDLVVVYFCTYNLLAYRYTTLPAVGDCSAEVSAALFGTGLLTSYLVMFLQFFSRTYRPSPPQPSSGAQ